MKKTSRLLIFLLFFTNWAMGQDFIDAGRFSGNFQIDAQSFAEDSTIGADGTAEKVLSNSFFNLIYNHGDFETGMRYEAYLNPIKGFDPQYQGNGIAYRYFSYFSDFIDITAGDFYEQFGSGLIFRAYEERQLGTDNAVDGLRVKLRPLDGVRFTGLIGKQRSFWDKGDGIVRAGDLSVNISELLPELISDDYNLQIGGSFVSKYEDTLSLYYNLPANVFAWSGRAELLGENFGIDAEYAYKYNDPHASNRNNFNPGQGLIVNATFFGDGWGLALNAHRIDNMDFRSQRSATVNDLLINYIPPLTKQHIYRLATVYPFATQLGGEIGSQAELSFQIPKSFTGLDYSTSVKMNFSTVNALDTTQTLIDTVKNQALRYDSPWPGIGDNNFFTEFNFEISQRWSPKIKNKLTFIKFKYDRDAMENQGAVKSGKIDGTVLVLETYYKISTSNSFRVELQHLWADQELGYWAGDYSYGNWFIGLVEYTVAPSWYFSIWDEYNYADLLDDEGGITGKRSIHYVNGSVAYVHGSSRVSLGYGRQRSGLLCVGGVCRPVPAANGFFLSVTSSF